MSNDYTLPRQPAILGFDILQYQCVENLLTDYGHACAEHVRSPLLARIAELEKQLSAKDMDRHAELTHRLLLRAKKITEQKERIAELEADLRISRDASKCLEADRDRLRASAEKYKADAERHQYLREQCRNTNPDRMYFSVSRNIGHDWECVDDLDSAIDAARKGEGV